jgi:hypothetical protein
MRAVAAVDMNFDTWFTSISISTPAFDPKASTAP